MTKNQKIFLGVISFWPICYIFIFFILLFSMVFLTFINNLGVVLMFPIVFILHILTIFLIIGLEIYYIIHIVGNKDFEVYFKVLFVVLVLFMNMIFFPVYWYLFIWKQIKL